MARVRAWFGRQSPVVLVAAGVLTLVILGVGYVGVAKATDQPSFCRSCHEMTPYQDAWSQGPHKEVSCVECHVDPGEIAGLLHKFVALGEVVSHVRGDRSFPRAEPPEVPDKRCLACHERVTTDIRQFDHAVHASRGPCAKCHSTVGHDVTIAQLQTAGIYSGMAPRYPPSDASRVAVLDDGKANLPGHVTVFCSRCHRMSATACAACHTAPHKPRGACGTCHRPGKSFVFAHPKSRTDCQTCHPRPAKHSAGACTRCHGVGTGWAIRHPRIPGGEHSYRSFACVNCHPRGLSSATCRKCHDSASGPRDD